jgi:hypothetical protein
MLHHMLRAAAQRAFQTLDPYFNYVTMLLHGDGTNGAQNNTFVDSSTNNFTITRNGNTTQGTFSPYGSNWSNYFDGANSALNQNSSTNWNFLHNGSSFTIEFDIFPTTTNLTVLASNVKITANTGFTLQLNSVVTNDVAFYFFNGSTYAQFSSTGNLVANQWNHVGITFNTSTKTCTFYINGTQRGSSSNTGFAYSSNNATYGLNIGCEASSYLYDFTGYLSNFRISNVVRTGMTTVPITPYTNDSDTKLLTCQSNRFIDNSSNAYTLDINGSPSVQRFSPFSPTSAYSTSVIGGSAYFDGSGDYLSAGSSISLSGDFTVEGWIYRTTASGNGNYVFGLGNDTFSGGATFFVDTSGYLRVYTSQAHLLAGTSGLAQLNSWNHIAFVRSSNTLRAYLNGVQVDSASWSATISGTAYINAELNGNPTATVYSGSAGYISNSRIGTTAVYTTAFTPSTTPLTAITGTQLLLSYTNAGILDNAMMNDLETVGNAQISTSVKKYGSASMYFDGSGDYLLMQASPQYFFGTGNFTIEFWYYKAGTPETSARLFQTRNGDVYAGINIASNVSGSEPNNIGLYLSSNGSSYDIASNSSAWTVSDSTWTHICLVRNGSTFTAYKNGIAQTTVTSSASLYYSASDTPIIGGQAGASRSINGYIDDFRITRGVARYTTNFTPPTAAFPNN